MFSFNLIIIIIMNVPQTPTSSSAPIKDALWIKIFFVSITQDHNL